MMMPPDVDPSAPTQKDGTPPGAPEAGPSLVGKSLGDYQVLRELGRGGMGVVYLARDPALDREVALKVLHPRLASDPEFERRFVREARTAAKLDHPHIVPVYSAGRAGDVLYMAMPFVKGETLEALMKRRGRLPHGEALAIVRQAALALGAAHAAALVHRDVKPNNLMIDEAGRVKVMDFGLMRSWRNAEAITEPGVFYGTPEYASPEQCEGGELDGRSDLYSLGAVLYQLLTGTRPHSGKTPMALFKKILEESPAPVRSLAADVPAGIARIVDRLLAKRADDRFANAEDLVAAIDAADVRASGRRPVLLAGAVALLLFAGLLSAVLRTRPAAVPPVSVGSGRIRCVVFDLKNGIPRPESAWYSIALSDLLIAALSKEPRLDVPPRDLLLWKMKRMELAGQAGEDERRVLTGDLGAQAYLSGTYYVQGGRVRLTLTGYRLPGSALLFPALSFERPEGQLFELIDQCAADVRAALLGEGVPLALRGELKQQAGREERALNSLSKKADPEGGAAKPAAPAAPPAPMAAAGPQRRKAADGADLTQAWYENRKMLESGKLKKEDFDALVGALHREFRRLGASRSGPGEVLEKAADGRPAPALEFACAGCGTVSTRFERCEKCQRYPVVRLRPPK